MRTSMQLNLGVCTSSTCGLQTVLLRVLLPFCILSLRKARGLHQSQLALLHEALLIAIVTFAF